MRVKRVLAPGLILAGCGLVLPAMGQQADNFYSGKSMTMLVSTAAGGTYDATGRLLARHLPNHLSGQPTIVVQNMPGAGGVKALMHLYNVAAKDGSTIGMMSRTYPTDSLIRPDEAKYDPARFNAIGSTSIEVACGVVWHTSGMTKFADLLERELIVGATGPTTGSAIFPLVLRHLTGAKFKLIHGYPGGNEITAAMEKGEVQGRFGWSWGSIKSRSQQWLDEKKIIVLVQMALTKASDLPDVPLIMEFARDERDRQALEIILAPQTIAWPLIAPPDLPAGRVALLRQAFDATMTDPGFLAEAKKLQVDIEPVSGEAIQAIVARLGTFDKTVVDHALSLMK
jgi:tripartite-type tricarboxylate transporter receptor subunit TctC